MSRTTDLCSRHTPPSGAKASPAARICTHALSLQAKPQVTADQSPGMVIKICVRLDGLVYRGRPGATKSPHPSWQHGAKLGAPSAAPEHMLTPTAGHSRTQTKTVSKFTDLFCGRSLTTHGSASQSRPATRPPALTGSRASATTCNSEGS